MTITQLQDKNTLSNTSLQLVKKVAKTQQQLLNSTNIDSHHQITSLQIVKKVAKIRGTTLWFDWFDTIVKTAWKLESVTSQVLQEWWFFNEFSGAQLFGIAISQGVLELSQNHATNMWEPKMVKSKWKETTYLPRSKSFGAPPSTAL